MGKMTMGHSEIIKELSSLECSLLLRLPVIQLPLEVVVLPPHLGQFALDVLTAGGICEHLTQCGASGFQLGEERALAFQLALQVLEASGQLYKLELRNWNTSWVLLQCCHEREVGEVGEWGKYKRE